MFQLLPPRAVDALVACTFAEGSVYSWMASRADGYDTNRRLPSAHGAAATAFAVSFVAERGDLTRILMANLAAKYGAPLAVAVGSVAMRREPPRSRLSAAVGPGDVETVRGNDNMK